MSPEGSRLRFFRLAIAAAMLAAFAADGARADQPSPFQGDCQTKTESGELAGAGLMRLAARIAQRAPITIIAFGSSSTEGAGASDPLRTYPARLEAEMKQQFPGLDVHVINRGIGGEDVAEMLKRFDRDIIAAKPDLVVWQLGTNAILRDDGIAPEQPLMLRGIHLFKKAGIDVVLMDPQFAPKVTRDPDAIPMVEMIAEIARKTNVPVFRRFEMMRHWRDELAMPYEKFLSPDLLHMNDFSYGCVARYLGAAIAEDVRQQQRLAGGIATAAPQLPAANQR
jgi:lysophospholipase L1-like esterase